MKSWSIKSFTIFLLSSGILFLIIIGCEQKADPFSARNQQPEIEIFSFDQDSLKFTQQEPFRISLKYQDEENQQLTATFKFLTGRGDIYHSSFTQVEKTNNKIVFEVPTEFDGKINFIPDTTGKVEIEVELSDKVKVSTRTAETFLYKNLEPIAFFTYQLTNVSPYELIVDASESEDPDSAGGGGITWYYWNFGDGTSDSTQSKINQHTYQNAGTYTVRLRVKDNDGDSGTYERVIPTSNQAPIAVLQVNPISGQAPLIINYTATNSIDPDGQVVFYQVDFDDGSSSLNSSGVHTYTFDRTYRVILRVRDNLGQTDTSSIQVTVATPPVVNLTVTPTQGPFPLECTINGKASYDPQGGALDHDIFIDGTLVYDNVDSVLHTFDAPKNYLVRLLVTNQRNGLTAQVTKSVTAINLNPVADFVWLPQHPGHLQPVTYTSTSYDSNSTDQISYYKWTFPQGDTLAGPNRSIVTKAFDAGQNPYQVKLEVWDRYRGTPFAGYATITKTVIPGDNAPGRPGKK